VIAVIIRFRRSALVAVFGALGFGLPFLLRVLYEVFRITEAPWLYSTTYHIISMIVGLAGIVFLFVAILAVPFVNRKSDGRKERHEMAIYVCSSCNQRYQGYSQPVECSNCKGRNFTILTAPQAPVQGYAPVTRQSPVLFVWFSIFYWATLPVYLLGVLLLIIGGEEEEDALMAVGGFTMFLAGVGFIVEVVLMMVILYRGWKAIQPLRQTDQQEANMPTPGRAVGFLFIPFYNLYWIFVALAGFAERANKYIQQNAMDVAPAKHGLAVAACVLAVVGVVPYLGVLAALPNIILIYLVYADINCVTKQISQLAAA
jgi:DNA-directed RNA polymerase subunit RPC12/RpoP